MGLDRVALTRVKTRCIRSVYAGPSASIFLNPELPGKNSMKLLITCILSLIATALACEARAADDAAMRKLATSSGCLTCHQIEPGGKGPDGMAPIGPPWRDVAARYKGVAGAGETLTRTVMTGSSPYASHWKGKVSGLAMPPNEVAITESNARALVGWILSLDPKP
jgi:cytochrome c